MRRAEHNASRLRGAPTGRRYSRARRLALLAALPLALLVHRQAPAADVPFLAVGDTLAGRLDETSARVDTPTIRATFAESPVVGARFVLEVEAPGLHTLELRSDLFDAYLVLRDEAGAVVAEDDDGAAGVHARLVRRLEA